MTEDAEREGRRRLAAEWEPHRATWCAWPHSEETWPGLFDRAQGAFAGLVRGLRRFEEVRLIVGDPAARDEVLGRDDLGDGFPLTLVGIPTDDAWIRDYGPLFAHRANGSLLAILWQFNAWGGKYPPWDRDAAAGRKVGEWTGADLEEVGLILEGGSIDVNGRGALLTSESCLLNPNRNPGVGRRGIEEALKLHLGVTKVLWLGAGIQGDDTDGHVDDLARFVDARTVVIAVEEDPRDENYDVLRDNLERLRAMSDEAGRPLRLVELPMPEPVYHQGERMPASYANFYVANGGVLVPTYRSARDRRALEILGRVFPRREVVPVDCYDLILGLGAVHCLTLAEPRAGLAGARSDSGSLRRAKSPGPADRA